MDSEQLVTSVSGERQGTGRAISRYRQILKHVLLNLPLIPLLLSILIIIAPIWDVGYPWGSDSWGHLQRAIYMGRSIQENGLFRGIVQTEWMPGWYMGDAMRVYYPPLTVWIMGLLTAVIGDVFVVYRLVVTGIWLILGMSVYAVGVMWGRNRWLAAAGALLSVTAPYTLHTIFAEGNLPRGLALLTFPWLLWNTELILRKKSSHVAFVLLAGLWAVAVVAHVMQASIFAIAIGLYVVFRVAGQVYIPLRRAILALIPIALGVGIAAAYLIPAYGHLEFESVPSLPGVKIDIFSITPSALLPYHAGIEAISIGVVALLLALAVTFYRSNLHHRALFLVGLLCVIFAFGPSGGLFYLLPLNQSLLPERFLNVSAILFPLTIATLPYGYQRRNWILAAVAFIVIVEFLPAWRVVHMRDAPPDERALAETLAMETLPGRVAPLTFPNPTAPQIYLMTEVGKHENTSGWALENTPHQNMIRRLLSAVDRSPAYLDRVLALWNTDYLLTRFDKPTQEAQVHSGLSFEPIAQSSEFGLWQRTSASPFAQELPNNRMLVIGDNATSWLFAFPFASEGDSADPADYTQEYLEHFSVIGLNRLPDNANIDAALGDWVRAGNTLIVDLSGMGSIYDEGFTLFGVHAIPLQLNDDYAIDWPARLKGMPQTLPFRTSEGPWIGATYVGLDNIDASLTHQGQEYPLLGYRDVGSGRVWFVGFNLFFLLDEIGQPNTTQTLVNYLLYSTRINRNLFLPAFDSEVLEHNAETISLRYDSPQEMSVVLSMTYFPRWQATVDGLPLDVNSHEHLIRLNLPAGSHMVALQLRPYDSPVVWLGWGVSIVFICMTAWAGLHLRRQPTLSTEDRSRIFDDHLFQAKIATITDYVHAPCPNCHFPFAIQGPPNEKTYPFFSYECLICGFALDYEGLIQGEAEQNINKDAMVRAWLKKYGISEEQLLALFEVDSIEALFEEGVRLPNYL